MNRTNNPVVYSIWLKRVLDIHMSKAWDAPQSENDEQEEERLNDLWKQLNEHQQQRLWGLSSDLNTLRDQETYVESDWEPLTEQELAREQREAYVSKDWDRLLESLRRPPRLHPRARVDYLRGRAWMEMGHPEVAVLFFDNASRLEPKNPSFHVLALECLKAMADWPEATRRAEEYVRDATAHPRLVFRSADVFHVYANATGQREYYERAIRAVDDGFARLNSHGQDEALGSFLAAAYATKALCLQHQGRLADALAAFDEAVERFPENTALVTARGLLKQQLGREDAVDDFKAATSKGSPLVWPYLELARNAARQERYEEVVELCQRGLPRAHRDTILATLLQLLAISLFHRGEPSESVRKTLQTASELDPLSEEIRANLNAFDRQLIARDEAQPQWQINPKAPPNAIDEVYAELQPAA